MRDDMNAILKEEFRGLAIRTRDRLGLTQNKMAEELTMNEASYSVIETGVYKCGTLTAILLLMMQEDPREFLNKISNRFKELEEHYEKEDGKL